ncbi:MAG TPA: methyl coenzyme M reductase-arginine methyltransferase Mmp10 [Candidatus Methanoculleus thermohydrogenotrophicum]|jgi:methanogenesis marker radical SAM protein|nr:methyl coenzyme M reductase-arginine methyltransferase Mmp10 [Candidatus Methanoculleus thermohydrogenotrophicum]NLM81149.1 methyl coenzyme M reductase-arginine methyltransferase Mmp10 [Candidatus Methanoculleus thermohydrogenotrophicum]HOB17619.1 methyl coenzyme M reductase-arginine methyltransferase Mmp10 [Candidatus Methanoculleus thermohydrogenotrophicum]HPZ38296.1 methyl coenzyme M reductase-arginine methyltransferase Mmp10 [Candidatus Methanoculleus thermohydrogenotrophicum]
MSHLTVDLGGRPGLDCRGFCSYCYFKHVQGTTSFGCKYCLPFQKGCDYCTRGVREQYAGFKDLRAVADETLANLQLMTDDVDRITISGGGDPSCYPEFYDLVELLASMEVPIHIGYTSGKGFDDPGVADFLIENRLTEVSYTVFAADPDLRRRWMNDPTPEASLAVLDRLCGAIDVYAAAVVIPGVNDGETLEKTCAWLEERGAKGLILMRFANRTDQGLILGNAPLIEGQQVHTVDEFRDIVTDLNEQFSMKISGTPLWDPSIGSPFAILHEPDLLRKLPRVRKRATVITGSVAAPYIQRLLSIRGGRSRVVSVRKEIACLITADDLAAVNLKKLEDVVIIPGRAFVHDAEAREILSADGVDREVVRGPEMLTADAETSMGMTRAEVLEKEMEGLAALINTINQYGR